MTSLLKQKFGGGGGGGSELPRTAGEYSSRHGESGQHMFVCARVGCTSVLRIVYCTCPAPLE